jgi:ABC-type multidrug transport system permease subunit
MIRLFELMKKNFRLLVRSKVSALIIFVGPLMLVSLLGLAYSQSSSFALSASVYSAGYTELSESLITKMANQNFRVTRQDSIDNCVGAVKRGESQACLVFPAGMSIKENESNEIVFYVDYSQINIVWLMLDVMSAKVSERSDEISKELTSDVLDRMWFVEQKINLGKATLAQITAGTDRLKNASDSTKSGFGRLDISVDFSGLDIAYAKSANMNISLMITSINSRALQLTTNISKIIESVEYSVSSAESLVNDSSVSSHLDNIDRKADLIEQAVANATAMMSSDSAAATAHIELVNSAFEEINSRLIETKNRIGNVKKERDRLLPEFDRLSAEIDSIRTNINALQSSLDLALQKIGTLKGRSADSMVSPINTRIEPITAQKTHFNSLFPTLLVLIVMVTGILLASTLMIVEKKSKAFFRNNFTPTSYITFNLSTYLTSVIVIFIQLLMFVSVSAFFFETEVFASVWVILLLVFLTTTVFICLGMLVGFAFRTDETATLASITLATILLLFSNAVIPLESLPVYLKQVAMYNPFVLSETALRQTVIFHLPFMRVFDIIVTLAVYSLCILVGLTLLQNALRGIAFMDFRKLHFGSLLAKEKKASVKPIVPGIAVPQSPAASISISPERRGILADFWHKIRGK